MVSGPLETGGGQAAGAIHLPTATAPLRFTLRKEQLRAARRREGRYLLRAI
jgi:hypothetical protein